MGVRSNRLALQDPVRGEVLRVNLGSAHLRYKDFARIVGGSTAVDRCRQVDVYRA